MTELIVLAIEMLVLVIATEAVTEIICDSELTSPVRQWWKRWTYRIDKPPVVFNDTVTKSSIKDIDAKLLESYFNNIKIFISCIGTIKSVVSKSPLYFHHFKIFVDKLISCGYCTSVWVSGFFAIWSPILFQHQLCGCHFVNWMIMTFAIHRLSNWFHVIYMLVLNGRIKTFDLLVKQVKEDGSSGESSSQD